MEIAKHFPVQLQNRYMSLKTQLDCPNVHGDDDVDAQMECANDDDDDYENETPLLVYIFSHE